MLRTTCLYYKSTSLSEFGYFGVNAESGWLSYDRHIVESLVNGQRIGYDCYEGRTIGGMKTR